jgi:hypothetical protein
MLSADHAVDTYPATSPESGESGEFVIVCFRVSFSVNVQ